jgi:hypothetical protein
MSDRHNVRRDMLRKNMATSSIRPIKFTHRENADTTIESICGSCFLVVARAFEEADLACIIRECAASGSWRRELAVKMLAAA